MIFCCWRALLKYLLAIFLKRFLCFYCSNSTPINLFNYISKKILRSHGYCIPQTYFMHFFRFKYWTFVIALFGELNLGVTLVILLKFFLCKNLLCNVILSIVCLISLRYFIYFYGKNTYFLLLCIATTYNCFTTVRNWRCITTPIF